MSFEKVTGLMAAALLLALAACTGGSNLASCKADGDCRSPIGKYCVSYTCVQCRGEDDCNLPLMCVDGHKCSSLTMAKTEPTAGSSTH
jgi:hypothetical protein